MSDQANILERAQTEFERAMLRNIKGLEYFSSNSPVLGASAKDVLIARGPLRFYHYHPLVKDVYRVPIMLVMATTNRGYIFDMVPGQSFVEFLLKSGFDVFMVDWEAPTGGYLLQACLLSRMSSSIQATSGVDKFYFLWNLSPQLIVA